jgi:hypothetical protein
MADLPLRKTSWAIVTEHIAMNIKIRENDLVDVFIVDLYF